MWMSSDDSRSFQAHVSLPLACLGLLMITNGWCASQITVTSDPDGIKHFSMDDKEYVPIGVNLLVGHIGPPYQTFDMFDTKDFDLQAIDHKFRSISDNGFNFVRLWLKGLDPDDGFSQEPYKISDAYVDNVLATLQKAKLHDLHVVLTGAFRDGVWLPKNYLPTGPLPGMESVGGMNRLILLPQMADSAGQFFKDLLIKLQGKDPDILLTVFYIDAYNELHFDLAQPPFSKSTGQYAFNGNTYNLDSLASRQALMDHAAQSWMHTVVEKIKQVKPEVMVTASTELLMAFGHAGFDGGLKVDTKAPSSPYPLRPAAYLQGGANLIDIHIYPSPARNGLVSFDQREDKAMRGNEIAVDTALTVPLIVGEFGAYKSAYGRPDDASLELSATEAGFCRYHVSGFAVWMWDGHGDTWTLQDAPLMKAVAPRYNADFCGHKLRNAGTGAPRNTLPELQ